MILNTQRHSKVLRGAVTRGLGVFICALSAWCAGQSARSDAMGGITILNDFSHIIYNPASINDFPDQISGSGGAYTDTDGVVQNYFGPILGKLSVGEFGNIGFVANNINSQGSSVLRGGFYKNARAFYAQTTGDTLPPAFPMIPHIIIGMDLKNIGIGLEGFYEQAHFDRSVVNSDRHRSEGIFNYGAKLNATINLNSFWLCPIVGLGRPYIQGETKDSVAHAASSDQASYVTAGMELGAELTHTTLVAGLYGSHEMYSLRWDQTVGPSYSSLFYDGYVGCTTYPFQDFLIALQYDLSLEFDDITGPPGQTPYEYHGAYQYHAFHAGVERSFTTTGIFESVVPRAGIVYSFNTLKEQVLDTITGFPLSSGGMRINAGIGITKDLFHLDLFVNIGRWDGIFTGPQAAAVTLTVGLSKKFLEK